MWKGTRKSLNPDRIRDWLAETLYTQLMVPPPDTRVR